MKTERQEIKDDVLTTDEDEEKEEYRTRERRRKEERERKEELMRVRTKRREPKIGRMIHKNNEEGQTEKYTGSKHT